MYSVDIRQRIALDALEPRWRRQGYTVVREPEPSQLPAFFKGFRPDAIAIGKTPQLVIEVLPRYKASVEERTRQLESLFAGREDWRLEFVYAPRESPPPDVVSRERVRGALDAAHAVAESDARAALLLAWAALEAAARVQEPALAADALTPGSLIDVLVSMGHATQDEGEQLRVLGEQRDALAHGSLDVTPAPTEVAWLIGTAKRVVEEREASAA
ncbi:MAG TPA: hypothetical protein VK446_04625 [Methylocystis sp.]|nr:hypothetical protein [Methylocystis sp.]